MSEYRKDTLAFDFLLSSTESCFQTQRIHVVNGHELDLVPRTTAPQTQASVSQGSTASLGKNPRLEFDYKYLYFGCEAWGPTRIEGEGMYPDPSFPRGLAMVGDGV